MVGAGDRPDAVMVGDQRAAAGLAAGIGPQPPVDRSDGGVQLVELAGRDRDRMPRRCRRVDLGQPLGSTVASGKKRAVLARHIRNRRLYDAIDMWAFCSLTHSPGCRAFYDQRRAAGDLHHQALCALGNRLVGILHGCLRARTRYDEHTAWAHRQATPTTLAA
jgi:hypothetical protein